MILFKHDLYSILLSWNLLDVMRLGHNDGVRADILPAPPGLLWHSQDEWMPMLDDPEQTERLLAALKAAIPFEAGVARRLCGSCGRVRAGPPGRPVRSSTTCPTSATWAASSAISSRLKHEEVAVISLTHVRVPSSLPRPRRSRAIRSTASRSSGGRAEPEFCNGHGIATCSACHRPCTWPRSADGRTGAPVQGRRLRHRAQPSSRHLASVTRLHRQTDG